MSGERSPVDKMDISEASDPPTPNLNHSTQVLRLANPERTESLDNSALDNTKYEENMSITDKNISLALNATNSHPLMYCNSPVSPDYPDLIPEKPKSKHANCDLTFNPQVHSTVLEGNSKRQFSYEVDSLKDQLPDFPESPSVLRKEMNYDLPLEFALGEVSDAENDKSVYEAHLSSNLQNVSLTMNEKEGNLNFLAHKKQSNKLRRLKVMPIEQSEESDVSSLDSVSESLKSDQVFGGDPEVTSDDLENDNSPEPIEPLSAAEERRHARHWQRMVLPGGEQRTIDMRVIEPYKRVLSHGGYLRAGGHTAIVIFSSCYLPDKSRVDYVYVMDNLFLYILWTLERLVTDDYVLVYLHGGATRLPAFSWLKKCYQMVGRKLRKNLSHLYLVHPTLWIKTMLFMAKPFISSKFYRKITYVGTLRELTARVPLEAAAIPDKVKAYDSLHCAA